MNKLSLLRFTLFLTLLLFSLSACKRKDPSFEMKPEVGEADISQLDLQQDIPKNMRIRNSERQALISAEKRRKEREKAALIQRGG